MSQNINALEAIHVIDLMNRFCNMCGTYYQHTKLLHLGIFKNDNIIGKVLVFFLLTTKFQGWGSAPNHGLMRIKDALIYNIKSNEKTKIFIDKYISDNK